MDRKILSIFAAVVVAAPNLVGAQTVGDFETANTAVGKHVNEFVRLDDDPISPTLLERRWEALRRAAARWLDQYSKARVSTLEAAIKSLKPKSIDAQALQLDGRSWLVAADIDGFGTAFILTNGGHGFRTTWAIDDPQTWTVGQAGRLSAWNPQNARDSCRSHTPEGRWEDCGPLSGRVGVLPKDAAGARRFYVDGQYAQGAGATVGNQLSIWSWDGSRARPLLSRYYNSMIDQAWSVRVRGEILDIRSKDSFQHMFACGGCEGRQVVASFRVSPENIKKLGRRSLTPDLDFVDKVYDRLARHEAVGNLATPSVTKFMTAQLEQGDADYKPKTPAQKQVGMIANWKLASGGICLETDSGGAAIFALAGPQGRRRIIDAKTVPSGACGGAGARS